MRLADRASTRARIANAANTLVINHEQSIFADNTDGIGLMHDLQRLRLRVAQHRLLVIGAGGACRGVLHNLLEAQPRTITIANRTQHRAKQIAAAFSDYGNVIAAGFDTLGSQTFDCIINTAATSLNNTVPNVPGTVAARAQWGYDLAYTDVRRNQTAFTHWLEQHGVSTTHDGLGNARTSGSRVVCSVAPHQAGNRSGHRCIEKIIESEKHLPLQPLYFVLILQRNVMRC